MDSLLKGLPMPPRSRLLLALTVFVLAAGLGLWAGSWLFTPSPEERRAALQQQVVATVLPRDYAKLPGAAIETGDGEPLRQALAGKWSLLFLGFTHCPDVCPATLHALAVTADRLAERGLPRPRVAFVSVDAPRDTPAEVARYAHAFDRAFIGATGDLDALHDLAGSLRVGFAIPESAGTEENYAVRHPATVFLIDPAGRLRAVFSAPHSPAVIARDLRMIRQTLTNPNPGKAS